MRVESPAPADGSAAVPVTESDIAGISGDGSGRRTGAHYRQRSTVDGYRRGAGGAAGVDGARPLGAPPARNILCDNTIRANGMSGRWFVPPSLPHHSEWVLSQHRSGLRRQPVRGFDPMPWDHRPTGWAVVPNHRPFRAVGMSAWWPEPGPGWETAPPPGPPRNPEFDRGRDRSRGRNSGRWRSERDPARSRRRAPVR